MQIYHFVSEIVLFFVFIGDHTVFNVLQKFWSDLVWTETFTFNYLASLNSISVCIFGKNT